MPTETRSSPIKRVLVANRGEIAVRVIRTCRELGIETIAVYSEADRCSLHVLMADEAYCIGPAQVAHSYLDMESIVRVCKREAVDAVHPGYGFLSENASFAERCIEEKLVWIGPRPAAIRTMGSKTQARRAAQASGVPVVPGDNGPSGEGFPSAAAALASAQSIGFPVLLKAAKGGGGRGMRLVADSSGMEAAFHSARREAQSAFGDGTLYLEKALQKPRHVEVQVFADSQGHVVHLGERDCSIQRRHQKIVEEAPSPVVDEDLRNRMGTSAVALAQQCKYVGAGTVEFLLDEDGSYYFLEMNTRLQVEHPVTEMIYGLDLVAWQIAVAEENPLPMTQEALDRARRGVAMECRIYAEDPHQFLPSAGTIEQLLHPAGPFVRDDSGVYAGATVSMHYDPLLSKLVVWGTTREQAIVRMRRALQEYLVGGVATNVAFHQWLMAHSSFMKGEYDVGFVEREYTAGVNEIPDSIAEVAIAAAAVRQEGFQPSATAVPRQISPWRFAFLPRE